jgi:hypothetical protein
MSSRMTGEALVDRQLCQLYEILRGKIHHIRGRPSGNKEADRILQMYQDQASSGELEFRRWPLKSVITLYSFPVQRTDVDTTAQM